MSSQQRSGQNRSQGSGRGRGNNRRSGKGRGRGGGSRSKNEDKEKLKFFTGIQAADNYHKVIKQMKAVARKGKLEMLYVLENKEIYQAPKPKNIIATTTLTEIHAAQNAQRRSELMDKRKQEIQQNSAVYQAEYQQYLAEESRRKVERQSLCTTLVKHFFTHHWIVAAFTATCG